MIKKFGDIAREVSAWFLISLLYGFFVLLILAISFLIVEGVFLK